MERLDGAVRRSLRRVGVPDAGVLAEVTRAWPAAVGPAIARAAWPQRIARDGTLHVTAVSSTWAFELGRLEADIRAKLEGSLGARTPPGIRFAPGPVPGPAGPEAASPPRPAPTSEDEREAADVASMIEDPGLRDAVRRAVSASLARGRGRRLV
jgi:hypothetical protein